MTSFTPRSEMFWRPDTLVDAARKLPEWCDLHQRLGRAGVCVDHIEREGGKRGTYRADYFTMTKTGGQWFFKLLATGRAPDVVGAVADGYARCGVAVEGVQEMLDRGLRGAVAPRVVDPFEESAGHVVASVDPFEELFV